MRVFTSVVLLSAILLFSYGQKDIPHCKFNFEHFKSLKDIPEPSDIVYDSASKHYYIVSDHGKLFECDLQGNVIRKAKDEGLDFEGVEIRDSFVYVSDETPRKVYKYRKSDLSLAEVYTVSWGGAANKAFESIAYNDTKKCFVLVSQQPINIVEYDEQFHELHRYPFHYARDMSGARWHKGSLYLLSGKDACIFKCDPNTYVPEEGYKINVYNPEGMAFDAEGNVSITSDDLRRLYFFKQLPTIK